MGSFPFNDPDEVRYDGETLIVRGKQSHYVADDVLPLIGRFFPRFKLMDIDSGHWVISEKPEAFRQGISWNPPTSLPSWFISRCGFLTRGSGARRVTCKEAINPLDIWSPYSLLPIPLRRKMWITDIHTVEWQLCVRLSAVTLLHVCTIMGQPLDSLTRSSCRIRQRARRNKGHH